MRLFYPDRLCLLLELVKATVGRAGGVQEHEVVRSLACRCKCAVQCDVMGKLAGKHKLPKQRAEKASKQRR